MDGAIPDWVKPTAERFADLQDLPLGWNSYSAQPIDPRNIEAAGALLVEIMLQ
jgi:hypothetical protein